MGQPAAKSTLEADPGGRSSTDAAMICHVTNRSPDKLEALRPKADGSTRHLPPEGSRTLRHGRQVEAASRSERAERCRHRSTIVEQGADSYVIGR